MEQPSVASGFGASSTAGEVLRGIDLRGKLAVVTGGYSGLGHEMTHALAGAGARVIVPARRPMEARATLANMAGVSVVEMDLADLDSVRTFARDLVEEGNAVDIVIANAGVMACRKRALPTAGSCSSPSTILAISCSWRDFGLCSSKLPAPAWLS